VKKGGKDEKQRAVAIIYDRESDQAPKIGASGTGFIAEQIMKIARENNIAFYQDRDLCEILLQFDTGTIIPEDLYEAVAKVLVFIYRANREYKNSKL